MIVKSFAPEVERRRGAKADGSFNTKIQLVDAKLEMVRARWLLEHVDIVCLFCWLDRVDRVQCDEIHGRLQRSFGASQGKPGCN
jgi:hypothetical protein